MEHDKEAPIVRNESVVHYICGACGQQNAITAVDALRYFHCYL